MRTTRFLRSHHDRLTTGFWRVGAQLLAAILVLGCTPMTAGETQIAETQFSEEVAEDVAERNAVHRASGHAELALSDDDQIRSQAIEILRAAGQPGVDALHALAPGDDGQSGQSERWQRSLDQVCGQRDCAASRLFWHTDLDAARTWARLSGKPILSLRLLGRLDQDLSCANSRFFRTVLYADPQVADLLRQRFVLHWSSERPVPVLDIDFGDGRRLRGTITGNSAHYVLDSHGRVLDALPGLYGAGMFREQLEAAAALAETVRDMNPRRFARLRARFHAERRDLATKTAKAYFPVLTASTPSADGQPPSARDAAQRAMAKSTFEATLLEEMSAAWQVPDGADLRWQLLALTLADQWRLSPQSREFALAKHGVEDATRAEMAISAFEEAVGADTVRNEFGLRIILHRWLEEADATGPDLESFNARVYSELFLTPASDPWLGLLGPATYLALDVETRHPEKVSDLPQSPGILGGG